MTLLQNIREISRLLRLDHLDEAISLMERTLDRAGPREVDLGPLCANLCRLYLQQGRFEIPIGYLQKAVQVDPGLFGQLYQLGSRMLDSRLYEKASQIFSLLIQIRPEDADICPKLGMLAIALGNIPEAENCLAKAKKIDPYNAEYKRIAATNHVEKTSCPFCNCAQADEYRSIADIVKCQECGMVYLRTRITKEAMVELYQSYADGDSHMALPENYSQIINSGLRREYFIQELLTFIPPEGTLLDIGCGWGAFLHNAQEKGFNVKGIEITKKCVDFANYTMKLQVISHQFTDINFAQDSFSVITMLHSLEHVPDSKAVIDKAYHILKRGGIFCGIVPNIESFCSQLEKDEWIWLDPNYHYVHFSPTTLKVQLEKAGFSVERVYTATDDYSREKFIELILQVHHSASEEETQSFIERIESQGQGEAIRFFARKPLKDC